MLFGVIGFDRMTYAAVIDYANINVIPKHICIEAVNHWISPDYLCIMFYKSYLRVFKSCYIMLYKSYLRVFKSCYMLFIVVVCRKAVGFYAAWICW